MDLFIVLQPDMDDLRRRNTDHKGQDGDQVFQSRRPLPLEQRRTQQHDVARLGVGKHTAPAAISVRVLKAAGQNDKDRRPKAVRHLPVKADVMRHGQLRSFSSFSMLTSLVHSASIVTAARISSAVAKEGASRMFRSSGSRP